MAARFSVVAAILGIREGGAREQHESSFGGAFIDPDKVFQDGPVADAAVFFVKLWVHQLDIKVNNIDKRQCPIRECGPGFLTLRVMTPDTR